MVKYFLSEFETLQNSYPNYDRKFNLQQNFSLLFELLKYKYELVIKILKYHTACPMAAYMARTEPKDFPEILKTRLPKTPSGFIGHYLIWKGPVGRYLSTRICANKSRVARNTCWNLLQGTKRGAAPVDKSFLYESLVDHVISLTTPPKFDAGEGFTAPNPVTERFGELVNRILKKESILKYKDYNPSSSSAFENSRMKGGQYQHVIGLLQLQWTGVSLLKKGAYDMSYMYDITSLQSKMKSKLFELESTSLLGLTGIIPLSEPLKVRTISKGQGLAMYYSKHLQKHLKCYVDRFPCMKLTHATLDIESKLPEKDFTDLDFQAMLDREKRLGLDFSFFVSGDYSSATDKLNPAATKMIFERLLNRFGVSDDDKKVFRSILYEQFLVYPKEYSGQLKKDVRTKDLQIDRGDDLIVTLDNTRVSGQSFTGPDPTRGLFTVRQRNGQLMGSILSFPVLCLANMICYQFTLEQYLGHKVSPYDLPAFFNGDDALFRANDRFYALWLENIKFVGFELSIGKNYVHPKYFTINSQLFVFDAETERFKNEKFLNNGLLMGQSKGGNSQDESPVWVNYKTVVAGASNKVNAHNRFLYYNRNSLFAATSNSRGTGEYNYFFPRELGGLGMVAPAGVTLKDPTTFQAQLACYLNRLHRKNVIDDSSLTNSKLLLLTKPLPSINMVEKTVKGPETYFDSYMGDIFYGAIPVYKQPPKGWAQTTESGAIFTKQELTLATKRIVKFKPEFLRSFRESVKTIRHKGALDKSKLYFNKKFDLKMVQSEPDLDSYVKNFKGFYKDSVDIVKNLGLDPDLYEPTTLEEITKEIMHEGNLLENGFFDYFSIDPSDYRDNINQFDLLATGRSKKNK